MMDLEYVCLHVIRSIHTPVRRYRTDQETVLHAYYGDSAEEDPVLCDSTYEKKLLSAGNEEYPVLFEEKYPVYYAVIKGGYDIFIVGPVSVEFHQKYSGENASGRSYKISFCEYERFCEEVLLLYYTLTGIPMSYSELNEKNYMKRELLARMDRQISDLFFWYQENSKKHNPYDREVREMNGIRTGDVDGLIRSMDETFQGEYGILSKGRLRSAKNLAIVGLAISARAAIEGGIYAEEAFSLNDSYILEVDNSTNIGEIEALVRQAKIRYAMRVKSLNETRKTHELIEECKNLIFQKMHSKISVRELAEQLYVSEEYLSALFKKTEQITISEYVLNAKIKLAENMLVYSEYTIEQIGLYLGFCSQSHFGKAFKKCTGVTPNSYRKKYAKKRISETD